MARSEYETRVRDHLTSCRRKKPLPSRRDLSALDEAQCRVLGGHLISWLSDWGPMLLAERAALSAMPGWDTDPLICFQSDVSGLVAAEEILVGGPDSVVWGLPADFGLLADKDEAFLHHVELHSEFALVAPEALAPDLAAKYPLSESESYLIHREESVLGPLFARGAHHLWKWNGSELQLLEEAFTTWVS